VEDSTVEPVGLLSSFSFPYQKSLISFLTRRTSSWYVRSLTCGHDTLFGYTKHATIDRGIPVNDYAYLSPRTDLTV